MSTPSPRDMPGAIFPLSGPLPGKHLAAALLRAQAKIPKLEKDKTVRITGGKGTYEYSYCPLPTMLAAIRPAFAQEGIAIVWRSWAGDMATMLSCVLVHAESGETFEASLPISLDADPKAAGSKITYFKRYLLGIVTGITAEEDDDGTASSEGAGHEGASGGGGGGRARGDSPKDRAIAYVEQTLNETFGGEKPWDPVEKAQVIKDLYGSGKWADFLRLPEPTILDSLRKEAHPALKGESRFGRTISLVVKGIRRPDECEPHDWPQKFVAGAVGAKGAGANDPGPEPSELPF